MLQRTLLCCALSSLLGGCVSKFNGEWLEDAGQHDTGSTLTSGGERRMALKFEPPSLVFSGLYLDRPGVVDEQSVQSSRYFLFDGSTVAQFGAMTAKLDGEHMTASVQGGPDRYFTRVKGKSIFPPRAILPALGSAWPTSPRPAGATPPAETSPGVAAVALHN
jgi:hypothetical protein